jgi:hypothetical protein
MLVHRRTLVLCLLVGVVSSSMSLAAFQLLAPPPAIGAGGSPKVSAKSVTRHLDVLQTRLGQVRSGLAAERVTNDQRFDAIDASLAEVGTKLDALNGRLDGIDTHVGVVDTHVAGVSSTLGPIASNTQQLYRTYYADIPGYGTHLDVMILRTYCQVVIGGNDCHIVGR